MYFGSAGSRLALALLPSLLSLCAVQAVLLPPASADPEPAKSAPAAGQFAAQGGAVASTASQFGQRYGTHLEPILQQISATPAQRQTITTIVLTYKPKIEPLRQEYRVKSQEFLDFIVQGKPADVVMARQGELNTLYSAIVTQYGMMRIEIRKQLSEPQRVKFEEYRRKQGWTKR